MTTGRQRMPDQPLATPGEPVGPPPTRHRRRGRRSHGGNTRAEILNAGRHEFAALGYRGASLRTIAARADVDPHLIAHYFGSKMQLFLAIAAPPFEPEIVLDQLYAAGQPGLGRRLAELVASLSTAPASRETVTALVRAAASEEQAAALIREVVNERLLLPLILRLGSDQPELRASLIASQIVGLTTATHIIRLEPLTCAPAELLATSLTPVFEHYLSGTLNCPR
ncbi:MAG TPA: TetR family transcriptional regulator [Nocardioidaceae bacterium]|nr:TetR family transcriptional regulator [Nocardioidaceae bacterium]